MMVGNELTSLERERSLEKGGSGEGSLYGSKLSSSRGEVQTGVSAIFPSVHLLTRQWQ